MRKLVSGVIAGVGSDEPSAKEVSAIAAAIETVTSRPSRPMVDIEDGKIAPPHSDKVGHILRLMASLGTTSYDFTMLQLAGLANASVDRNGDGEPSQEGLSALLAIVAAVEPRNELEAALAVQMASNHSLTTELLGRARSTQSVQHLETYANLSVKLQRTFTSQIEALARLRGQGQQHIRVEHVTVEPGAQAIVGDVHHYTKEGRGIGPSAEKRPHDETSDAPVAALRSPDASGTGVPLPGDAERPLQPARGQVDRTASGKQKQPKKRVLDA